MIPEPVVNGCLPLASPGRHNSTPSPVWYAVCDVARTSERLSCSREAPVFAFHSKNLEIGDPEGSTWLEARKVHSILRGRVFHESVPYKLRTLILRHQQGYPKIDSNHLSVIPARQRVEQGASCHS